MSRATNSTVADVVAGALARHGVSVAFGQSIPSMLHLAAPGHGIRQIGVRTEKAAAMMADGYARVAGRVAVCTSVAGPGAALLAAGLSEAHKASTPVVAIVQDTPASMTDRNAAQEMDQAALLAACTKLTRRVEAAERIEDYLDLAFVTAASGRPGPVALLVPQDLMESAARSSEMPQRRASLGACPLDRSAPDPVRIDEAAALIAGAACPVVIAGGGVHGSGAAGALTALQETASLPVATTTMGKGAVDETHPLSLGVVGYAMGERSVTRHQRALLQRADVVVLVGNRTNQNGTDSWRAYPAGARYVHIDIDPQEIGRNYEALRLVGDARLALDALLGALRARGLGGRDAARAALIEEIRRGRERFDDEVRSVVTSNAAPLRPERIMAELDLRLEEDDIVVADASYATIWMTNYLRARSAGMRFISPRGLAGIGWGFPMALGARMAAEERTVYCIAGDGGFGHAWSELETARRNGLDVTLLVLNNGVLGYQQHAEDAHYGGHTEACEFTSVDHAAIARACGCTGIRVESAHGLGAALDEARGSDGPVLIDIVTDPAAYPPITAFDGKLAS
jgi:acetolactate synthase-1/2/3 large subunit